MPRNNPNHLLTTSSAPGGGANSSNVGQLSKKQYAKPECFRPHAARLAQCKTSFEIGKKVEAIDPEHPHMFIVCTVADIRGFRMRLHIDDASDNYDFWVNRHADTIFPPGWTSRNGKKLTPPRSAPMPFAWPRYVVNNVTGLLTPATAFSTPDDLYSADGLSYQVEHDFRVGHKLEALDRQNPHMICCASVKDILCHKVLIHFDGWQSNFDYWADHDSNSIFPVGWCERHMERLYPPPSVQQQKQQQQLADQSSHNRYTALTVPTFSTSPDASFDWTAYLREQQATAAPFDDAYRQSDKFFQERYRSFDIVEVVDPYNNELVRLAEVQDVYHGQLRLRFVGWPVGLDFWIESDSWNLFPAGFCSEHGFPLTTSVATDTFDLVKCSFKYCNGLGNTGALPGAAHLDVRECPYEASKKQFRALPDRVSNTAVATLPTRVDLVSPVSTGYTSPRSGLRGTASHPNIINPSVRNKKLAASAVGPRSRIKNIQDEREDDAVLEQRRPQKPKARKVRTIAGGSRLPKIQTRAGSPSDDSQTDLSNSTVGVNISRNSAAKLSDQIGSASTTNSSETTSTADSGNIISRKTGRALSKRRMRHIELHREAQTRGEFIAASGLIKYRGHYYKPMPEYKPPPPASKKRRRKHEEDEEQYIKPRRRPSARSMASPSTATTASVLDDAEDHTSHVNGDERGSSFNDDSKSNAKSEVTDNKIANKRGGSQRSLRASASMNSLPDAGHNAATQSDSDPDAHKKAPNSRRLVRKAGIHRYIPASYTVTTASGEGSPAKTLGDEMQSTTEPFTVNADALSMVEHTDDAAKNVVLDSETQSTDPLLPTERGTFAASREVSFEEIASAVANITGAETSTAESVVKTKSERAREFSNQSLVGSVSVNDEADSYPADAATQSLNNRLKLERQYSSSGRSSDFLSTPKKPKHHLVLAQKSPGKLFNAHIAVDLDDDVRMASSDAEGAAGRSSSCATYETSVRAASPVKPLSEAYCATTEEMLKDEFTCERWRSIQREILIDWKRRAIDRRYLNPTQLGHMPQTESIYRYCGVRDIILLESYRYRQTFTHDISKLTPCDFAVFVTQITGWLYLGNIILNEEITGEVALRMQIGDFLLINFPLGDALKVMAALDASEMHGVSQSVPAPSNAAAAAAVDAANDVVEDAPSTEDDASSVMRSSQGSQPEQPTIRNELESILTAYEQLLLNTTTASSSRAQFQPDQTVSSQQLLKCFAEQHATQPELMRELNRFKRLLDGSNVTGDDDDGSDVATGEKLMEFSLFAENGQQLLSSIQPMSNECSANTSVTIGDDSSFSSAWHQLVSAVPRPSSPNRRLSPTKPQPNFRLQDEKRKLQFMGFAQTLMADIVGTIEQVNNEDLLNLQLQQQHFAEQACLVAPLLPTVNSKIGAGVLMLDNGPHSDPSMSLDLRRPTAYATTAQRGPVSTCHAIFEQIGALRHARQTELGKFFDELYVWNGITADGEPITSTNESVAVDAGKSTIVAENPMFNSQTIPSDSAVTTPALTQQQGAVFDASSSSKSISYTSEMKPVSDSDSFVTLAAAVEAVINDAVSNTLNATSPPAARGVV